jgi:cytoskeleton protein RodZ
VVDNQDAAAPLFPERVGDRLRAARTASGMDLPDVANKTRVPLRHLQAIENSQYEQLPGATYCIGFAKAFARTVGLDEATIANALRDELHDLNLDQRTERAEYQFADATRSPSRSLAWIGIAVAILITTGYAVIRHYRSAPVDPSMELTQSADGQTGDVPAADDDSMAPVGTPAALPSTAPALPAGPGEVVLTANNPVWLRIYDASDKVLFEKEMTAGERYVVPVDANEPKIRTGRADLIAVTIDGKAVAPLGPAERTIKDVGVSAVALRNRQPAVTAALPASPVNQSPANAGLVRP